MLLFFGFLAWGYQAIQPPAPKICGSPNGPLITAPRIKLRDGRYLAYKEHGVPKDSAKYKIIFVHSFASCRHNAIVANTISPVWFIFHHCSEKVSERLNVISLNFKLYWRLAGHNWKFRSLHSIVWQIWLWREWSKSKTNCKNHCFWYRGASWSIGTRVEILCHWIFHGWPGSLELSKVYS